MATEFMQPMLRANISEEDYEKQWTPVRERLATYDHNPQSNKIDKDLFRRLVVALGFYVWNLSPGDWQPMSEDYCKNFGLDPKEMNDWHKKESTVVELAEYHLANYPLKQSMKVIEEFERGLVPDASDAYDDCFL